MTATDQLSVEKTTVYTHVQMFRLRQEPPGRIETRWLILDWPRVPSEAWPAVESLIRRADAESTPAVKMGETGIAWSYGPPTPSPWVKLRRYFRVAELKEINALHDPKRSPPIRLFQAEWDFTDYIEDEDGCRITMTDVMSCIAGQKDVLVFGEIESVLRIGPTPMANRVLWCEHAANVLAQFVDVVEQITATGLLEMQIELRLVETAEGTRVVGQDSPNAMLLRSVAPLVRQLYSKSDLDNLARKAFRIYRQFCSDEGKKIWIDHEMEGFERFLKGTAFLLRPDEVLNLKLLDFFLYTGRLMHAFPERDESREELEELIRRHGVAKVRHELNGSLRHLVSNLIGIYYVIRQDFRSWLGDTGLKKPTIRLLRDILG